MEPAEIMLELSGMATAQTKKTYRMRGVREPYFGVPTGLMRPLVKKIGKNQAMAEALYATGNYDAMYLAGMIADPKAMTEADFDRWLDAAYCFMISDYVVAVTLAETDFAQAAADRWIQSGQELRMSAGWACYEWLLGSRPDAEFDSVKLSAMLETVATTIHGAPNRTRYAMNGFLIAVGVSYLPLHDQAVQTAERVGKVEVSAEKGTCSVPLATEAIGKAADKGRLGFKRKSVRC